MADAESDARPLSEPKESEGPLLSLEPSDGFAAWLADQEASLALTVPDLNKLFLLGTSKEGALSLFERTIPGAGAIGAQEDRLVVAADYQVITFRNLLVGQQPVDDYDALFAPRVAYFTGDLDIRSVAIDAGGRILFSSALFSCVGTTDPDHSFRPLWRPPSITALAAETRCQLTGMAVGQGRPRLATLASLSDQPNGWRDIWPGQGVLMELPRGWAILEGLSLPQCPRGHRGKLWLLEGPTGCIGTVDVRNRRLSPVATVPGFVTALDFLGDYALVTSSVVGPCGTEPDQPGPCALHVIDVAREQVVHSLTLGGLARRLPGLAVLPGIKRPMALGFKSDQIRRVIAVGPEAPTASWAPPGTDDRIVE